MSKQEVENNTHTEEEKVSEESVFSTKITTMSSQFEELMKIVRSLSIDLKAIKKEYSRLDKKAAALEKSKGRKKRSKEAKENGEGEKNKSGFHKPAKISEELTKFLSLGPEELVSRPRVTTLMSNYIKEHDLKKEGDGRKIDMTKPGGDVLAKLLKISTDTELTFFNLQTYLKPHYIVEPKVEKVVEKVVEKEVEKEVVKSESVEEVKPRRRRHVEATA